MFSQPLGNETPSLLSRRDCREDLATPESPEAPGALEDSWVLGKVGDLCFRAVRTKAALGKGRELKPKWKTLSRVLENLGFMDSSALWNKR